MRLRVFSETIYQKQQTNFDKPSKIHIKAENEVIPCIENDWRKQIKEEQILTKLQ